MYIIAILLPIAFLNAIQRGMWQSRKRFKFIFILELILTWPVTLTTLYYGLYLNNPWLMWSGILLTEMVTLFVLYQARKKLDVYVSLGKESTNSIESP